MKVNATTWPIAEIYAYLAGYRGHIELSGETVWLSYWPTPKVA
jgi:hypothetical protein